MAAVLTSASPDSLRPLPSSSPLTGLTFLVTSSQEGCVEALSALGANVCALEDVTSMLAAARTTVRELVEVDALAATVGGAFALARRRISV